MRAFIFALIIFFIGWSEISIYAYYHDLRSEAYHHVKSPTINNHVSHRGGDAEFVPSNSNFASRRFNNSHYRSNNEETISERRKSSLGHHGLQIRKASAETTFHDSSNKNDHSHYYPSHEHLEEISRHPYYEHPHKRRPNHAHVTLPETLPHVHDHNQHQHEHPIKRTASQLKHIVNDREKIPDQDGEGSSQKLRQVRRADQDEKLKKLDIDIRGNIQQSVTELPPDGTLATEYRMDESQFVMDEEVNLPPILQVETSSKEDDNNQSDPKSDSTQEEITETKNVEEKRVVITLNDSPENGSDLKVSAEQEISEPSKLNQEMRTSAENLSIKNDEKIVLNVFKDENGNFKIEVSSQKKDKDEKLVDNAKETEETKKTEKEDKKTSISGNIDELKSNGFRKDIVGKASLSEIHPNFPPSWNNPTFQRPILYNRFHSARQSPIINRPVVRIPWQRPPVAVHQRRFEHGRRIWENDFPIKNTYEVLSEDKLVDSMSAAKESNLRETNHMSKNRTMQVTKEPVIHTTQDSAKKKHISEATKEAPSPNREEKFKVSIGNDTFVKACAGSSCGNYCPSGIYKLDVHTGCPTCECCEEIECFEYCEHGYEADEYGCPICECSVEYEETGYYYR